MIGMSKHETLLKHLFLQNKKSKKLKQFCFVIFTQEAIE